MQATVYKGTSTAESTLLWGSSLKNSDVQSISENAVDEIRDVMGTWTLSGFDWSGLEQLLYQGFDYKTLYKVLAVKKQKGGWNDEETRGYITVALAIHQMKGNLTEKNWKSLSPEAQELCNVVIGKLGIVKKHDSSSRRLDLTFPRIAALFPMQLSVIANRFPKDFASNYDSTFLDSFMKTTCYPSLIPAGKDFSVFLIYAYNCYATDQSIATKGLNYLSLDKAQKDAAFKEQFKFTNLSYNSGVVSQVKRVRAHRFFRADQKQVYDRLALVVKNSGIPAGSMITLAEYQAAWTACYTEFGLAAITGNPCDPIIAAPVAGPSGGGSGLGDSA
nr:nucleocapsid-like protein ORF2b [Armillaria bunya-like virus 2]